MNEPILSIKNAVKRYGSVNALDGVNLDVAEGEFLTLLGPSGSGKTTLLSAIAGFITLDEGRLALRSTDITGKPPEHRDFGMVFQGYALFPTMTVRENVGFPLKIRKRPATEIKKRVGEAEHDRRRRRTRCQRARESAQCDGVRGSILEAAEHAAQAAWL